MLAGFVVFFILLLPGLVEAGSVTEKTNMDIIHCPSCGSSKIKKVRGPVSHEFEGDTYTVPGITYHACPECGERVYDGQALNKMQAASPAFRGTLTAR
jgi:YgiT-type zinc finger domain-containing protein